MKRKNFSKKAILEKRHQRILKKIKKGSRKICLKIKKTNSHIYAFAIDHENQKMLFSSSSSSLKLPNGNKENSLLVAKDFCEKLKSANIGSLCLDRGGHRFHGKIQLITQALIERGIKI